MKRRSCVLALTCCTVTMLAASEFPVNVRTTANQCNASLAPLGTGGFIVVWSSYYGSSGRSNDIFARRFDLNGQAVTDEFQVNDIREGNQTCPAVATDMAGVSFVVWQGPGAEGSDSIHIRTIDANGVALTQERPVSSSPGPQLRPSIASNGAEATIVVWESIQSEPDGQRSAIHGRLLDSSGGAVGVEIAIDEGIWNCRYPDVAMDAAGNFAVVWMRDRGSNTILSRLFDPNGLALTAPFTVSTTAITSITCPSVGMDPAGNFVIAWDGDPNLASRDNIHARCYEPNGTAQGEPFLVNTPSPGPQQWPQVAIDDHGRFVVVWQSDSGDPNVATDIFARQFRSANDPAGDPYRLNDHTEGKQRYPEVAKACDGSFLAVWESDEQDGSDYGLFGHIGSALPTADFNGDGIVDFSDFGILAMAWRTSNVLGPSWSPPAAAELRVFCDQWIR